MFVNCNLVFVNTRANMKPISSHSCTKSFERNIKFVSLDEVSLFRDSSSFLNLFVCVCVLDSYVRICCFPCNMLFALAGCFEFCHLVCSKPSRCRLPPSHEWCQGQWTPWYNRKNRGSVFQTHPMPSRLGETQGRWRLCLSWNDIIWGFL